MEINLRSVNGWTFQSRMPYTNKICLIKPNNASSETHLKQISIKLNLLLKQDGSWRKS